MWRQCFERSEHLKRCISYLPAQTPAAGQPYRKSRVDVPTSLSSPLELGRAPSATERASSLHRSSEDGHGTAHPCIRGTAARKARAVSPKSHRGREKRQGQNGRPRDVFILADCSQQRDLRLLLLFCLPAVIAHRRPEGCTSMTRNTRTTGVA